ncbi:MAG: hypothetical protein ACK55Z_05705 [bacterium]
MLQRGDEPDGDWGDQPAQDQGGALRGLRQLHLHHDGHEGHHLSRAQYPTRYFSGHQRFLIICL